MNHRFVDWKDNWQDWYFSVNDEVDKTVGFNVPDSDKSEIGFAEEILEQLDISGEISNFFGDSIQMYIPVTKPGSRISIKADLISGMAYIHCEKTNFWKKLIWLHKMPGPHNARIRGNWMYTRIWGSVVDLFVILLFFSSITGFILWYHFKNDRIIGLMALLTGLLSLFSLIIGLTI
jgi:hypothetical protein